MKKIILLLPIILLAGCATTTQQPASTDTIPYSWTLTIAGVGPDESFEQTIPADTLALKNTFEDHSDHVFIDRQSRSNYLDIQDDLIPGNIVKFVGTVKALDAAAGNRYYQVATIDELTKVGTPTQTQVEELLQRYGFCETDDDCIGMYGQCPLSCQIAINKKYQTTVQKIITNFRNAQSPQCTYKCKAITKVSCNPHYKCVVE